MTNETGLDAAVKLFRREMPDWTYYSFRTHRGMTRFIAEIARKADNEDGEERHGGRGDTPLVAMQNAIQQAKLAEGWK